MKPDWKDAPEWAQYLAMDGDGQWWWFEKKPTPMNVLWNDRGGKEAFAGETEWQKTLQRRPKD